MFKSKIDQICGFCLKTGTHIRFFEISTFVIPGGEADKYVDGLGAQGVSKIKSFLALPGKV